MMRLEQVRRALQDRNLSEVSRRTGINHQTLFRIKSGAGNPSYKVVETLSDYLTETDAK